MADAPTTQLAPNPRFEAAAQPAIAKLIGFRLTAFGSGEATVELDLHDISPSELQASQCAER